MVGDDDPSSLAWLWVIEALSAYKEISNTTLQGFIDAAPVGNDKFSEKTKEMVSLRCLEQMSTSVVDPEAPSTSGSRSEFDFSRGCQDVLQEILNEIYTGNNENMIFVVSRLQIPLSNLKMTGAELLKSDVCPFINHKRASTFKCHLEQLREAILEGTHPHTDYLKETSGLFPQNNGYSVLVNDAKRDDHSSKNAGTSTDTENMVQKDNSVSLTLENWNKSSKEHGLDNNSSPSKRSRLYSAADHLTKHHEKQVCLSECVDFFRTSKKVKLSASTSFESKKEKLDSELRQEVSEHLTERILLVSEQGDHRAENSNKETLVGGSAEDSHNRCAASKLCQPSSHIEVSHDESNMPFNNVLMPQHTFGGEHSQQLQVESAPHVALPDGIQHEISRSKPWSNHEKDLQLKDPNDSQLQIAGAPDHTGYDCGVEKSGNIVYQGEKINLEVKKQAEQNLCLKCNEGDQLWICDLNVVKPVVPECRHGMANTIMHQHISVAEPCNNTSMDESDDTAHHPIPTNDANAENIHPTINLHQPKQTESDIAIFNLYLSRKPVACAKTIVGGVNGCGAELSNDSDECHNEKEYLEAKKHEFLHSHYNQDFSAMSKPNKQNLCMKCNQGGQLLACKTTTCQLMVHENCLGAPAQLDGKGNFVCPFCAYSHTISEYVEAKKKASLARKELANFITKGKMSQAVESLLCEFHTEEHCFSRKSSKFEHIYVENNEDDQLTRCEDNREDHVGEHAKEANNLRFERCQQQAPISCIRSSCREKETVSDGSVEVLREEEIGEMSTAKHLTGVEENYVPTGHVNGHVGGDIFTSEKSNIALVNKSIAGDESPQEMTKQLDIDGEIEPVCAHYSGKEKFSENECDKHSIPRYSTRYRKHEMQSKFPASPVSQGNQLKRKKIPWTAEEEEMIREGVQKFGKKWKNILAFGSHVFDKDSKRRTPQDLKDKWKNMSFFSSLQKLGR
ncbi:unnamed protein product [Sphenostylis stenocarpa]|uniref:Uncharacterized protein n=1 Tax=Sphenostylis stenocarpa TaxID=92480 RepID=A0AA86VTE4_9FABA|nr:unnamed protein product [Sphenostylis stenocarpa]